MLDRAPGLIVQPGLRNVVLYERGKQLMPPRAHQGWFNGAKKLERLGTSGPEVSSELCHRLLLCHLEQLSAPSWASVSPHVPWRGWHRAVGFKLCSCRPLVPLPDLTKQLPSVSSGFDVRALTGLCRPGRRPMHLRLFNCSGFKTQGLRGCMSPRQGEECRVKEEQ